MTEKSGFFPYENELLSRSRSSGNTENMLWAVWIFHRDEGISKIVPRLRLRWNLWKKLYDELGKN